MHELLEGNILKTNEIFFSLEHIDNVNFFDAYRALKCKQAVLKKNEDAFLLHNCKSYLDFFKKNDYIIQVTKISDVQLLNTHQFVLPIEIVIALFLKHQFNNSQYWLYCSNHNAEEIKIISGIGAGILFSRTLDITCDVMHELKLSINYFKRFGLKTENLTLYTNIDSLIFDCFKIKQIDDMYTIENALIDFVRRKKIKRKLFNRVDIDKTLKIANLCIISFLTSCILWILTDVWCNFSEKQNILSEISELRNYNVTISNENLDVVLNKDYKKLKTIYEIYINANIFELLNKVKNHLKKENIESIAVERNFIKCIVNDNKNNIIKLYNSIKHNKNFAVQMKFLNTADEKYEMFDEIIDENVKAEICIKKL